MEWLECWYAVESCLISSTSVNWWKKLVSAVLNNVDYFINRSWETRRPTCWPCHKFALLLILFSCVILHSNPCVFFRVQPLPFCSALPHRLHPQTHLFSIFSLVPSSISACQFPLPSARSFVFLPDLPALLLVPFACLTSPCDLPAWSLDLSFAYSLSDIVRYFWPPGSWPRLCFPDIPFAYSLLVLFAVDWLPGIELCSGNKPILCLFQLWFCVVHLGSRLPFCQPWQTQTRRFSWFWFIVCFLRPVLSSSCDCCCVGSSLAKVKLPQNYRQVYSVYLQVSRNGYIFSCISMRYW